MGSSTACSTSAAKRSRAVIQKVFEGHGTGRETDLEGALAFVQGRQRRRAVVVVISDFMDPGPWPRGLSMLCRKHDVHAVLVHDPLDTGAAGLGLIDVVDPETGRWMLVDGARWAARTSLEERTRSLVTAGARTLVLGTGDDPFQALHRHFQAQGARK